MAKLRKSFLLTTNRQIIMVNLIYITLLEDLKEAHAEYHVPIYQYLTLLHTRHPKYFWVLDLQCSEMELNICWGIHYLERGYQ